MDFRVLVPTESVQKKAENGPASRLEEYLAEAYRLGCTRHQLNCVRPDGTGTRFVGTTDRDGGGLRGSDDETFGAVRGDGAEHGVAAAIVVADDQRDGGLVMDVDTVGRPRVAGDGNGATGEEHGGGEEREEPAQPGHERAAATRGS